MNNPRPDHVAVSLLLIAALAVALPNMPAALNVPAGILILALPAYWWSRTILPSLASRSAEAIFATLVLTAVIVITLALVLYGSGIRITNIVWAVSLAALGIVGWRLSIRARPDHALVADAPATRLPVGRLPTPRRRDLAILLIAAIVLGGTAVLARTPLSPPSGVQGYSQLWLLPQPAGLQLGVASFELRQTHYRLEFVADGAVVRHWDDVLLAPGQRFTQDVVAPGSFLEARLYLKDVSSPDPYRTVHIGVPPSTSAPP
jgi:hypothetical protein